MSENTTDENELTGSIFDDDVDLDEIPDNPNHLPADVYTCQITKAILKKAKSGKIGLIITYQIKEGPYNSFWPFTEWLWAPRRAEMLADDEKDRVSAMRANSTIKKRYVAFGIPADEMKKTEPKDLVGLMVRVQTFNKNEDDQDGNAVERIKIRNVMSAEDYVGSDEGMDVFANTPDI